MKHLFGWDETETFKTFNANVQTEMTQVDLQLWKLGHPFKKKATIVSAGNETSYERLDGIIATAGSGFRPHEANRSESFKVVVGEPKPQTKSSPHVKCEEGRLIEWIDEDRLVWGVLWKKKEQDKNTFV